MFKQITREEYLALADAGVKVSAWESAEHFYANHVLSQYVNDLQYCPDIVEDIRDGDSSWRVFYAWVDDEEDADVQP